MPPVTSTVSLAGATLFGAADRGLLQLEPGDTEELSQTLAAVADDFPWTKESDHGDARERTASFSRGARDGVEACRRPEACLPSRRATR